MTLDPSAPLPDISEDEPAGPNLEFDLAFGEFERLTQGKPEQQYGTTIVPAEEPDWKAVVAAGWELLARTYDLRVAAQVTVARLHREGVPGYADALGLIRQLVETRWTQVHPVLDPEDDNDPTLRANALLAMGEPVRVVRVLRNTPLARSSRAGTVSWRDISVTNGALEAEADTPKLTQPIIDAAFRETDREVLAGLSAALAASVTHIVAISAAFDEQAGYGTGPDLNELVKLLREMQRMIDASAGAAPAVAAAPADAAAEPGGAPAVGGAPVPAPAVASVTALGPLGSREDALRLLALVVEYYERNEPSSPMPLLIERARRLADKGFMDILRDLAPDGVSQAERIVGTADG